MKKLILFTIASMLSFGVWADCESSQKTEVGVVSCLEKQSYENVAIKFNKLKGLSRSQISYNPTVITDLELSQKTWLAYRDSYCTSYSNYHNEKNNHANCIISMNKKRADQLQQDIDAN